MSDDKLLEELLEMEQWARTNLDVLRLREGDCFKAKLRQLSGVDEKRIYVFLFKHQKRIAASAPLAAQLAKLNCMVMVPRDTGLHAAVPSTASESRKARSPTDAGLSAQEESKKRTKTEAGGQTDAAGRSDSRGSAGASNSDSVVRNTLWRYAVRNTGAMGSAVSLSTSSGSGQARGSSSAASGVRESSSSRVKTDLQEAAEAEGPSQLKLANSSSAELPSSSLQSGPYDYFERQSGAWCGMHALNNLLRGPMVTKDACRLAARSIRNSLDGADVESAHLDPQSGFLSIDVINLLGSANLGIHVEEAPTAWGVLRHYNGARALINWNQSHWTVLEAWPPDAPTHWRHTNSIEDGSNSLRYGRAH